MRVKPSAVIILAAVAALSMSACRSTYYTAWGILGKDKADLLLRHTNRAETQLEEARKDYQSAVDRLRNLNSAATLDERTSVYKAFARAADNAADERDKLSEIAQTLERTGEDLFNAWDSEIGAIEDSDLTARSRDRLQETQRAFRDAVSSLNNVRAAMDPLYTPLMDQVSYLRFNVSDEAMSSVRLRLAEIESSMLRLDREIQTAKRQLAVLRDTMPR